MFHTHFIRDTCNPSETGELESTLGLKKGTQKTKKKGR